MNYQIKRQQHAIFKLQSWDSSWIGKFAKRYDLQGLWVSALTQCQTMDGQLQELGTQQFLLLRNIMRQQQKLNEILFNLMHPHRISILLAVVAVSTTKIELSRLPFYKSKIANLSALYLCVDRVQRDNRLWHFEWNLERN